MEESGLRVGFFVLDLKGILSDEFGSKQENGAFNLSKSFSFEAQ